jgi:hypothetical protein
LVCWPCLVGLCRNESAPLAKLCLKSMEKTGRALPHSISTSALRLSVSITTTNNAHKRLQLVEIAARNMRHR